MIGTRRERGEHRNFMIGLFLPTMSGDWTVSHATNLATYRYEYLRDWLLLVNAGFSAAGQDFAARLCDWIFILSDRPTDFDSVARRAAEVKTRAARYGRTVKVCLHPYVICRETEREVNEVRDYIIRHADQETLEQEYQTYMGPQAITHSHRQTQRVREDFIFLGTFQIFGTPEQVVEKFMRLKRAGCDGVHLVFLDWMHDLKFFGERVLPMLRQAMGDTK